MIISQYWNHANILKKRCGRTDNCGYPQQHHIPLPSITIHNVLLSPRTSTESSYPMLSQWTREPPFSLSKCTMFSELRKLPLKGCLFATLTGGSLEIRKHPAFLQVEKLGVVHRRSGVTPHFSTCTILPPYHPPTSHNCLEYFTDYSYRYNSLSIKEREASVRTTRLCSFLILIQTS